MHHNGLLAGECPSAALLRSARGDIEQFVARLALAEGDSQLQSTTRDLFQQRVLATCELQRLGAQHGRLIRLDDQPSTQFLHDHQQVHRTAVETALCFGHGQRSQTQFGQRIPMGLGHPFRRVHHLLARLKTVVLVDEAAHCIGQLLLFVGEREIHVCLRYVFCRRFAQTPRIICEMMLRWISFDPP